jgi:SPP1 family phage portal protein
MTIEQLNSLIADNDISKLKTALEFNKDVMCITNAINQYNTLKHDVFDETKRPKKKVTSSNEEGKEQIERFIDVTRIGIPFQKKIVNQAVAILGSPIPECTPNGNVETAMFDGVKLIEQDNKMDFKFKKISRHAMSESECAELWYMQSTDPAFWQGTGVNGNFKMKNQIMHKSYDPIARTGCDDLYPVYDFYNDMIAFGRGYKIKVIDDTSGTLVDEEHLDIYTADRHYFYKKVAGTDWIVNIDDSFTYMDSKGQEKQYVGDGLAGIPNNIGKIPVIYYPHPIEWADVQSMIERLEKKMSNHADTNDRFDSPILFAEGDVLGFPDKDDSGKLLIGKNGAKANYLTWDNAPESMRMEIENLFKLIYSMTNSADFSFEQVKGLGDLSGVALKMIFMDTHMKAAINEELLGESVQRRYNFLKAALIMIDPKLKPAANLKIKPKFEYFLPENVKEKVDILNTALAAGLISKETAVGLMPKSLVSNAKEELKRISDEEAAKPKPVANPNDPSLKVA